MVQEKEFDSAAAVGLCCTHNACAPMRCLTERNKNSSGDEIANVNFNALRPGSYPNSLK